MDAPTTNIVSRLSPINFTFKSTKNVENQTKTSASDENSNLGHIDTAAVASNSKSDVTCVPFVVEFRRLLQSPKFKSVDVIPGVSLSY